MPRITEFQAKQLALLENIDTTLRNLLVQIEDRGLDVEDMDRVIPKPEVTNPEPVKTNPIAHITVAEGCLGWDEDEHNEDLVNFMGVDPSITAWCAHFGSSCLESAGLNEFALGGVAKKYVEIGNKAGIPKQGDLCIHRNHLSFFYGYADKSKLTLLEEYGKVRSLEDWELVKCNSDNAEIGVAAMVLGGNQSDEVNISPKEWYDNYSKFLGYYRIEA